MKRILTVVLCAAIFCGTASGWGGTDDGYYYDSNVTTSNGTYSNARKELIIEFD